MDEYLSDALEMVSVPAALFEAESLNWVASNGLTVQAVDELLGDEWQEARVRIREEHGSAEPILRQLGVDPDIMRRAASSNAVEMQQTPIGSVATSCMTAAGSPRPALLLVTLTDDERRAELAHHRAVEMLRIHESALQTIRVLEDAVVQMRAAIETQRALIEESNRNDSELTRLLSRRRRGDTPNTAGP